VFLFESNWLRPYSTCRIRQIVHQYAATAGIQKRVYPVYPHPFRHQIITFLTRKGIISQNYNSSAAMRRRTVSRSIVIWLWPMLLTSTNRRCERFCSGEAY
jgi:hypothetical protein